MNKYTKAHYPAHKLPDDLRGGIDPSMQVTVTIVEERKTSSNRRSLAEILESAKPFRTRTPDEILSSVRAWRDAEG